MHRLHLLLAVLLGAGCYSPSVEPCRYVCNGATCPSGLTCNAQGMCASSATEMCGGDGGPIADAPPDSSCGWPAATNVDPCALRADQVTAPWNIRDGEVWTIDTDMLTVRLNNQTVPFPLISQNDQTTAVPQVPQVALVTVGDVTLSAQGGLQVIGARPLTILVNGTALIAGSIEIQPTVVGGFACPTSGSNGGSVTTQAGAGGGGGGGFGPNDHTTAGQVGGNGGASPPPVAGGGIGGTGGNVSNAIDARRLSPLRPGCPGGQGGTTPNPGSMGGRPGAGGGAIQISARLRLTIAGMINAPGGGGAVGTPGGGGGGGAGGAILLEAAMVDLVSGARLCANGGGGATGISIATGQGQIGLCSGVAALGGGESPNGTPASSSGGAGATAMLDAEVGQLGKTGTDSANPATSGGGGGGGVGRIRINGQLTVAPPVLSTPKYTVP
ncbi:MAG: hypothetical protein JWP01_1118 [Myxococcales bacterium]|nr:hypothetical protein [Myxococcales bacterium]